MKKMTLKELCTASNVSRRAVQGYEQAGLLYPSGKTNRGYLLYDETALERVCHIRLLQHCGFRLSEVCAYYRLPIPGQLEILKQKKLFLEDKQIETENYIAVLSAAIAEKEKQI